MLSNRVNSALHFSVYLGFSLSRALHRTMCPGCWGPLLIHSVWHPWAPVSTFTVEGCRPVARETPQGTWKSCVILSCVGKRVERLRCSYLCLPCSFSFPCLHCKSFSCQRLWCCTCSSYLFKFLKAWFPHLFPIFQFPSPNTTNCCKWLEGKMGFSLCQRCYQKKVSRWSFLQKDLLVTLCLLGKKYKYSAVFFLVGLK